MFARRVGGLSLLLAATACGGNAFTVASQGPSNGDDGGGAQVDAGGDDAGSDAATGFCASKAGTVDFCSDFDEAALPESWDAITKAPDAQIGEDGAESKSPAMSVLAVTPALGPAPTAGSAPTSTAALVKRNLPKGGAHIQLDMEIDEATFPNANDPTGAVTLLFVTVGKDYGLALSLRPSKTGPFGLWFVELPSIAAPSTAKPTLLKAAPAVAAWSHLTLDVPAQASGAVTIHVDQNEAQSISINPGAAALTGDRTLSIGALAQGACGEAKLRFDNVTWSH